MKNPTLPTKVKASTLTILELKYLIAVFASIVHKWRGVDV
jgi:hypothetical protein